MRWSALGYGLYLINRLPPVYVSKGRTRREFLRSLALFVVLAGAVVDVADVPLAATLGLCLAGLLPGGGGDLGPVPGHPHP